MADNFTGADSEQVDFSEKKKTVSQVFTPRTPVSERDLFAGRIEQLGTVFDVIAEKGAHGVIFGERGVGKTSLANVISSFGGIDNKSILMLKVTCESRDDFSTLWRKAFRGVNWTEKTQGFGFQCGRTKKDHFPNFTNS